MVRWKEFEAVTGQVLAELAPRAEVTVDDHIPGRFSEALRQIDVSVRWHEADRKHLLIVQARDRSTPADINAVGEFAAVIDDVGADRGILVCRSGFTTKAQIYARNRGIRLWNIHDASSANWDHQLTVPIVWVDLFPEVELRLNVRSEVGDRPLPYRNAPFVLTADDGGTVLNLPSTFEDAWNNGSLPRTTGIEHLVSFTQERVRLFVDAADGERAFRPVDDLRMAYVVRPTGSWLGHLTPTECRGYIDALADDAFVVSHLPIGQVPTNRDERWQQIEDPKAVAGVIRGTLVTTVSYGFITSGSGELGEVTVELDSDEQPGGLQPPED
jgi:hypothetical protein